MVKLTTHLHLVLWLRMHSVRNVIGIFNTMRTAEFIALFLHKNGTDNKLTHTNSIYLKKFILLMNHSLPLVQEAFYNSVLSSNDEQTL